MPNHNNKYDIPFRSALSVELSKIASKIKTKKQRNFNSSNMFLNLPKEVEYTEDGVDHINTYGEPSTTLGKLLCMDTVDPVSFDSLGKFSTLKGLWKYITSKRKDSKFRRYTGYRLNKLVTNSKYKYVPNVKAIVITALYNRIIKNANAIDLIKQCDLPIECYYCENGIKERPPFAPWYLKGIELIFKAIKNNEDLDVSELFDKPEIGLLDGISSNDLKKIKEDLDGYIVDTIVPVECIGPANENLFFEHLKKFKDSLNNKNKLMHFNLDEIINISYQKCLIDIAKFKELADISEEIFKPLYDVYLGILEDEKIISVNSDNIELAKTYLTKVGTSGVGYSEKVLTEEDIKFVNDNSKIYVDVTNSIKNYLNIKINSVDLRKCINSYECVGVTPVHECYQQVFKNYTASKSELSEVDTTLLNQWVLTKINLITKYGFILSKYLVNKVYKFMGHNVKDFLDVPEGLDDGLVKSIIEGSYNDIITYEGDDKSVNELLLLIDPYIKESIKEDPHELRLARGKIGTVLFMIKANSEFFRLFVEYSKKEEMSSSDIIQNDEEYNEIVNIITGLAKKAACLKVY